MLLSELLRELAALKAAKKRLEGHIERIQGDVITLMQKEGTSKVEVGKGTQKLSGFFQETEKLTLIDPEAIVSQNKFGMRTAIDVLANVPMTKKLRELLEDAGVDVEPFLSKRTTRSFRINIGKHAVDDKMAESVFKDGRIPL